MFSKQAYRILFVFQVLKYIPVMARPLVLMRDQHPVRWTGVYADIEVIILLPSINSI